MDEFILNNVYGDTDRKLVAAKLSAEGFTYRNQEAIREDDLASDIYIDTENLIIESMESFKGDKSSLPALEYNEIIHSILDQNGVLDHEFHKMLQAEAFADLHATSYLSATKDADIYLLMNAFHRQGYKIDLLGSKSNEKDPTGTVFILDEDRRLACYRPGTEIFENSDIPVMSAKAWSRIEHAYTLKSPQCIFEEYVLFTYDERSLGSDGSALDQGSDFYIDRVQFDLDAGDIIVINNTGEPVDYILKSDLDNHECTPKRLVDGYSFSDESSLKGMLQSQKLEPIDPNTFDIIQQIREEYEYEFNSQFEVM